MANPRIPYRMTSERPPLPPMQGKRILVHLVVNVEHWVFENAMPRTIITPPHGKETVPDVPNFSWADYGMRAGMPRILKLFTDRGLPASTSFNAGVIDAYPSAAEAMLKAGWEFIGHGMHQKAINHAEGGEEALIVAALDKIQKFTGQRPRGWLSPGLRETVDTPDLLKKNGIDYVCDWVIDDQPDWMRTKHGPMVAMPYNVEINDSITLDRVMLPDGVVLAVAEPAEVTVATISPPRVEEEPTVGEVEEEVGVVGEEEGEAAEGEAGSADESSGEE